MTKISKSARIWAALLSLSMLAAACGSGTTTADENGVITIDLNEFSMSPGDITVKVGDTVTIVLNNTGDKDHEWMVGRNVNSDEGFPDGYHDNFFEGMMSLDVSPMSAAMGMPGTDDDHEDDAMDMGDDDSMDGMDMGDDDSMDGMDMGDDDSMDGMDMDDMEDHGFMIMRNPGETASITFTVTADQVGEWEMGCFEEDGAHYDDGMKGTFTVES